MVTMTIQERFNGDRLALFIRESGLTHKGTVDRLKAIGFVLSPQTISNWIRGKSEPNATELAALAQVLGRSKDDFYYTPADGANGKTHCLT